MGLVSGEVSTTHDPPQLHSLYLIQWIGRPVAVGHRSSARPRVLVADRALVCASHSPDTACVEPVV